MNTNHQDASGEEHTDTSALIRSGRIADVRHLLEFTRLPPGARRNFDTPGDWQAAYRYLSRLPEPNGDQFAALPVLRSLIATHTAGNMAT